MDNSGGTLEEQIAHFEAKCKSEAEALSYDELRDRLMQLKISAPTLASEKTIAERLAVHSKARETARQHYLGSGGDPRHDSNLRNVLRLHTYLFVMMNKQAPKKSTAWLADANRNQEEHRQEKEAEQRQLQERDTQHGQHGNGYNQHATVNNRPGMTAARGSRAGANGSRGKTLVAQVAQATQPNPSSYANGNLHDRRERTNNATRDMVMRGASNFGGASGSGAAAGAGLNTKGEEMGVCCNCEQRKSRYALEDIEVRLK